MRKAMVMVGLACSIASGTFSQTRDKCPSPTADSVEYKSIEVARCVKVEAAIDTVHRVLVVFTKIPGMLFTKDGYCIRSDKRCIRNHLDNDHKPIKRQLHVIGCIEGE